MLGLFLMFLNALKMILNSTYFKFNNHMYKQNFGTPMSSPLSLIIADLVMHDLEERETLGFLLPFYVRYVEDIAMTVPSTAINEVLNTFNSSHPRLQFALEIGGKKLNFLDVIIINNNNFIEFNWYHKLVSQITFFRKVTKFSVSTPSLSKKRLWGCCDVVCE